MIYFFYGDNDYLIDQRVAELRKDFVSKNGEACVVAVDINSVTATDLMGQLTAVSLFVQHQMVIVKAITASSDGWAMLEKNIDQIPDDTVVVLTDVKSLSKVKNLSITRTFKKLKASGAKIEKLNVMRSRDVRTWLASEVTQRKLSVDNAAQAALLQLTAGDDNQQARLATELDKLSLLQRPITVDIIKRYVEPSPSTNAFAIFDAAVTGQSARAAQLLRQLRGAGEDYNRFLGLLASQELALAAVVTGATVKLSPYQLSQAQDLAHKLGDRQHQLEQLGHIASVMASLDEQVKLAKPEEAWVRIEIALAKLKSPRQSRGDL